MIGLLAGAARKGNRGLLILPRRRPPTHPVSNHLFCHAALAFGFRLSGSRFRV